MYMKVNILFRPSTILFTSHKIRSRRQKKTENLILLREKSEREAGDENKTAT